MHGPTASTAAADLLGIVLCAGGSSRMGRPKALLSVDGRPLLLRHLEAWSGRVRRTVVVLGAQAERIAAVLPIDVEVVINEGWQHTGPRESLALALAGVSAEQAVLITPVDVPPASPEVLDALLARGAPAVPTWEGADGHPVLAVAGHLHAALQVGTLKAAMADAPRVPVQDPTILLNLNTPGEWSAWLQRRHAPGREPA